jgi:uncharacterized protein (TIRG00374 family)
MKKDSLKKIIPLLFGLFLVYYSFKNTSLENRLDILSSIFKAEYKFVLLSIFFGVLSHLSRAFRWKYLLKPLGYKINGLNSVMSVFSCFLSNLGMPRSGEVLRASIIHYYEKIPFEKSFGTIVTERIIDVIILSIYIFIGITISSKLEIPEFSININFLFFLLIFILISFFFFKSISKKGMFNKIYVFVDGLKKGVFSVSKIENKSLFFTHTVFIWGSYFFMFYIVKFSMPETYSLGIEPIFIAFVAGAIAMSLTNGGIGSYPLAIAAVLNQYEISYEVSLAFGWIVWTSQTLMIVVLGSLSFIFLPILNKNSD